MKKKSALRRVRYPSRIILLSISIRLWIFYFLNISILTFFVLLNFLSASIKSRAMKKFKLFYNLISINWLTTERAWRHICTNFYGFYKKISLTWAACPSNKIYFLLSSLYLSIFIRQPPDLWSWHCRSSLTSGISFSWRLRLGKKEFFLLC